MEEDQSTKVSICIPTYNQTAYLKILLVSIRRQSFKKYEIIVNDDSSTEDVKNLVASFDFGGQLRYFHNKPALGSPANWNAAIQRARGEYVKIMHHDDAFTSDSALAELIHHIELRGDDYVFSDSSVENVQDPGKNRVHQVRNIDKLIRKPYLLFFGNSIGGPSSLLIKRKETGALQYDPAFIWLVDIEYYIRLFEMNKKGSTVSRPLILTHDSAEHQITSTVLKDFDIQVKEQAMLYNRVASKTPALARFFMQVYVVRILFRSGTKDNKLVSYFDHVPRLVKIYFYAVKIKALYFAYKIVIRLMDVSRKILLT